jgi:hypothetical protein
MKMRACIRGLLPLLGAAGLLVACGGEAQPRRAAPLSGISPAHCVESIVRGVAADPVRCPAPLRVELESARGVCREAGGTLEGLPEGDVWGIDVNGDGRQEIAFELEGNVGCEGAASVFSCGSLGCGRALYELRDGKWQTIGALSALAPEHVELTDPVSADGYATLAICAQDPCVERWFQEWRDGSYQRTRVEVRGVRVAFAEHSGELRPLLAATAVLAAPGAAAAEVGRYEAGFDVAIIGTAETADYYYVSPCNACESGFVPTSAVGVR